ncbi:MAG: Spy/CpxP family protein refolding chaperone [Lysobacterales bacterium]|jgi:Spy/CpxP family protein refolding chaperone
MKNRITFTLLLVGLMFAASAIAHDHGRDQSGKNRQGRANPVAEAIQRFGKAIRQLDLSEDQKTAIHSEFSGIRESVKPLVRQLHEGKNEIRELVMSEKYDADAVSDIAANQGALTADITMLVSGAVANAMSHLSDEQRAELMIMSGNHHAHRMEHREFFKQRMNERRDIYSQEGNEDT